MAKIKTRDGYTYKTVSRWIKPHEKLISKRSRLWDYGGGYDAPKGRRWCWYFKHGGREYALGQFIRLSYPEFYDTKDGHAGFLSGYDAEGGMWPLVIELDEYGEYIRLWRQEAPEIC